MESTKMSQLGYNSLLCCNTRYRFHTLQNNQKKDFWLVSEAEHLEAAVSVQSDALLHHLLQYHTWTTQKVKKITTMILTPNGYCYD